MLVIHATFPIDADSRDEALDLITSLAEQSRDEDGVIDYRVATDIENPNVFRFFERYENEPAFEAHAETEHFREFEEALPELLADEPEVRRFNISDTSAVDV